MLFASLHCFTFPLKSFRRPNCLLCIIYYEWIFLKIDCVWRIIYLDFPGGSKVKALHSQCRGMQVCSVTQSHLAICNPMGCSPPGSYVHRISQARTLEWVIISPSRGSSWPRISCSSCIGMWILYYRTTWEASLPPPPSRNAEGLGLIPVYGTRFYRPQLRCRTAK